MSTQSNARELRVSSVPRTGNCRRSGEALDELTGTHRDLKVTATMGHHDETLSRYISLYSRIPKFKFRKRIAELRGERVPMSADDLEAS